MERCLVPVLNAGASEGADSGKLYIVPVLNNSAS